MNLPLDSLQNQPVTALLRFFFWKINYLEGDLSCSATHIKYLITLFRVSEIPFCKSPCPRFIMSDKYVKRLGVQHAQAT